MMALNRLAFDYAIDKVASGEVETEAFEFTEEDLKQLHQIAGDGEGALDPFFLGIDTDASGDARYGYPIGKWSGGRFKVFLEAIRNVDGEVEEIKAAADEILAHYEAKQEPDTIAGTAVQSDGGGDGGSGSSGGSKINPGDPGTSSMQAPFQRKASAREIREFYRRNKVLYRDALVRRGAVDEETRTVRLSFSSEYPAERWFGIEILSHDPEDVNLSRLRNGAALLREHFSDEQIGVIERAWLDGRKGRAVVRFAKTPLAEKEFQMVVDEIRRKVSVGYQVTGIVDETENEDGVPVYRVAWEPLEISIVSIPLDDTVGVGRKKSTGMSAAMGAAGNGKTKGRESGMELTKDTAPAVEPVVDVDKVTNEAREAERKRVAELLDIGRQFPEMEELARQFIDNGGSVDEFRKAAFERLKSKGVVREAPRVSEPGLTEKDLANYSIFRALKAQKASPDRWDGLEREISDQIAEETGRPARGVYVPAAALLRSTVTTGALGGGNLVGTDHLGANFIEYLRPRSVLLSLGAMTLPGLVGDVDIPSQVAGAGTYWIDNEAGDVTENTATLFGTLSLSPKTVGAKVPVTRKMLLQSDPVVDRIIANSLTRDLPTAIDIAGINGGGTNEPTGILQTSGIGDVAGGTNGAAPTWSHVVNLEREVAIDNADIGALAYLTTPQAKAKLKTTETASGSGRFVWPETANEMNGYRAVASNNVPSNLTKGTGSNLSAIIFGNFNDVVMGMWGSLDLKIDEITNADRGGMIIRAFQDIDIGLRHAASFAAMQDAITT